MSQPLWEDIEADRVNAARDALKATFLGRLWYAKRWRLLEYCMPRAGIDAYHTAMRTHFYAMARDIGRPVLTTKPPQ